MLCQLTQITPSEFSMTALQLLCRDIDDASDGDGTGEGGESPQGSFACPIVEVRRRAAYLHACVSCYFPCVRRWADYCTAELQAASTIQRQKAASVKMYALKGSGFGAIDLRSPPGHGHGHSFWSCRNGVDTHRTY